MRVGDISIDPVVDGTCTFAISDPFLSMPPEVWEPHRRFLTGDGRLELVLGGFLVRTKNRVVVIDCGVGRVAQGPFRGGAFIDSLATLGVTPGEVTDVLFTHLHIDHVGWATQQGQVVFPHAAYRCDERDWAHFVGPDPGATRKLSPLVDRMEFWDHSGPVLPGVDAVVAPGHTPGSAIFVISSGAERALLLGDVVYCPAGLLDDEWAGMSDVDPALAKRTRNALARELEGQDVPVAAAHFQGMQFGRLLSAAGTRRWVFD
jgi:glyoxylase-like metal-dependent hydrolase (beta-lactamase superfamily II)